MTSRRHQVAVPHFLLGPSLLTTSWTICGFEKMISAKQSTALDLGRHDPERAFISQPLTSASCHVSHFRLWLFQSNPLFFSNS
jgi:hypothetical protein